MAAERNETDPQPDPGIRPGDEAMMRRYVFTKHSRRVLKTERFRAVRLMIARLMAMVRKGRRHER